MELVAAVMALQQGMSHRFLTHFQYQFPNQSPLLHKSQCDVTDIEIEKYWLELATVEFNMPRHKLRVPRSITPLTFGVYRCNNGWEGFEDYRVLQPRSLHSKVPFTLLRTATAAEPARLV